MKVKCDWCGDEATIFYSCTDEKFSEVLAYCDHCEELADTYTEYEIKITHDEYVAILAMQQL